MNNDIPMETNPVYGVKRTDTHEQEAVYYEIVQ